MKTVAEKIILNYFGKFINGIHKDNLTVDLFKGNFQLENISLNQQYFDQLNTPFKLSFSSIGKLDLVAPISRLSSAPVQCTIDNIYAVFEFRQSQGEPHTPSPQELIEQKKEFIEKYIREMFQDYLKKLREKDEKKDDGIMAKLGKKIIDNLQLTINNVHIRFQEIKPNHKYAWGVTLEEISFMTTDESWKPTFVDRSSQGGSFDKLLKKMSLKKLNVYWQSGSKSFNQAFISQLENHGQKTQSMKKMIKDPKYSIISLTSEVKLTINQPDNLESPLYELSVDLAPIVFELQKIQVSEMIDFTKKNISENEQILKNLSLKKKKTKKQLELKQKNKLEQDFQQYVDSYIDLIEAQREKTKPNNQMDEIDKIGLLKTLSVKVEDQEILLWSLKPIKKKVREVRQKQLKKKKKGWFGGEYHLNEQQTKALQNFVDDAVIDEKQRPSSCLMFSLSVVVERGRFAFLENKGLIEQEKLEFEIGKIDIYMSKSKNDSSLDLIVGVQNISLNLEIPIYQSEQRLRINIIRNVQSEDQFHDPGDEVKFIKIKYSKKIEGEEKPIIKTDIIGQVEQVIVTYKKMFMKKFKSFFTFNNFNDSLKNQTIKKWDQIKEKNQDKNAIIEQESSVVKMFNIQVKVISPLFVFPIGESECWCLNLGRLSIASDRDNQKQIYPIKVQSAYFRYYPDMKYCLSAISEQQLKQRNIFSLINNIDSTITYVNYLYEKKQNTHLKLPNLQISFNEKQYKNLLSLKDIFKSDLAEGNFIEVLKRQRQLVERQKVFDGWIQKKGGELDKWISYYGILSGEFIHLYGSEKELKCIEKVNIKNIRLEYIQETKVIQLIDQQGIIEVSGTQFENNSEQWRDIILSQMKSFMTIFEIVEELSDSMVLEDNLQMPRKRKDTSISLLVSKRIKTFQFFVHKMEFNYKDNDDKDLMVFQILDMKYESKEQNRVQNKSIHINNIQTVDYIHIYKDSALQKLVSIQNFNLQIHKNKNDLQKQMQVDLDLEHIYINWKPDVLIILLKLIYSYFAKEAKLRVDDGQEKTRDELFEQVLKNPKFLFSMKEYERSSKGRDVKDKRLSFVQKNKRLKQLLKLTININKTQVLMIHRQTHLKMFKLIAKKIDNELVIGENQKFVIGTIHSLQLFQMTGYPRNNYKQQDKVQPYLIVKPKQQSNTPLVEYKWSSYEPFVLPNSERINSFMHVTINPIEFAYFQQITFRFIDYLLIQIILLLNQPEMLVANQNLLQQLKKSNDSDTKKQEKDVIKILFSEYDEVIRKIIDPYFMDMYFEVKQPSVIIKTEKDNAYYHQADFKNIIFVNEDNKNARRFSNSKCIQVLNYVYEEVYEIMCNQCNFYSVKGSQRQLLFDPVDIALSVNKLIMEDEINLIYPQVDTYDRSFQTTTKMSKLVISKLTRQEYLLLNKLVNFNIVYDDNKDELFIHNFKITKLLSPKPIYYDLVIPEIQLIGKEGGVEINYDLFCMSMQGFKLVFQRNADLNSSFKIYLKQAKLFGFEYDFTAEMKQGKPHKIQLMEFKSKHHDQNCSDITIKMKTSGQKIIQMNIEYIEAYLKLHLVQLIFEWSLLQDWVFPTVSIYANDITFHLTIHDMSAWLKETLQTNSTNISRSFRLVGVFCYKFHRKANFSQQHLEQMLKKNQISVTDVHDMPQVSYMTILLNTEIFNCLASGNKSIKRQVMQKVTLNMIEKKFLRVASEEFHKIKPMNQRNINLDRGLLKFSFTDIFLIRDIITQIGNEREYIGKLKQLVNPSMKIQSFQQQIPENQLSSVEKLDINVETLSLYLINNCRSTFIPTLRLHINNAVIGKVNTARKDLLKATFQTSVFYFNASIFKWEPMLQKVDINFSKLIYQQELKSLFFSLEALKPLLINISKQMLVAIKDTTNQWNLQTTSLKSSQKTQIYGKNNLDLSKKHQSFLQTVQLVSQYVIRNETGYPIEIYGHNDKSLLYRIEHLSQIDYQYELQKYDEQSEVEILIGIDICHPKLKFKRITHISLGLNINFTLKPQIQGKDKEQSFKILPINSLINFITKTKDSKRYLTLKTSKWIEDYLNNSLQIRLLPFDHPQTIKLREDPHDGREVSLYRTITDKDRYRYIGQDGVLKIMGKALVYNYTPIPLHVCGYFLLPDQFVTIFNNLTIQNLHHKDCKGIKVDYDEKNKIYYIYCEGYIIDYSNLYFELEEAKAFSHQFMTNGIKYTIYLLHSNENKIKVRLEKKLKSIGNIKCSAFIKPAIGNQIFELQNHSNSLYEYQTYGYLSTYTGNQYKDFKKIIEVTPLYVLSNTTNYKIKVCQMQSCQSVTLQPGERIPFFWENKAKPKQIKISALKDNIMWGYSGPLSISQNTHSFVIRNSQDIKDYRILSTQIETTNTINFVHIIDCNPKNGNNIMLCNQIEGVTLTFVQLGIFEKDYEMLNPHEYIFTVKAGQQLPFGYQVPLQKHSIKMEIILDENNEKWAGAKCTPSQLILDFIQNNLFEKKIDVLTRDKKKKSFLLKLSFEGNVKKLKLMRYENTVNEIKEGQYTIKVPNIIISLIGYHDKTRKQIVHLAITGLELQTTKTNRITQYSFTIKNLQIDNCLQINPMFPVIFQSTVTKNAQFFMQFMIQKDNFNNKLIHYIGLSINKFVVAITSQQIQCFQQNLIQVTKSFNPQNANKQLVRQYQLFQKPTDELNTTLYFIQAQIHPLKANITFKHVNNWGGRLLRTLASIDDCNLSIAGKKISHFSSRNTSQFFNHLKKHYEQGISKTIIPLLGNLAIIGSPLSLAQRIGSGFKDLIQLPSEGFNVSPLEGTKGLAIGAGSLVKNTFQGAFNSIQSMTGSVGNGISSLAFDDDFSKQRMKIQSDKSQHIGQGLANGAKSIANGFSKGITGLVTSPVQGAQENGIGGFFVGSIKGLAGLVVKPVSGIFDATTKTFEGIKNTPSYFGDKTQKLKRKRQARVFYGFDRQFKPYNEQLSMCSKLIAELDQQRFQNLSWYGAYHLLHMEKSKQRKNPILIITHQYVLIVNLSNHSLMQKYDSENVLDAVMESTSKVKLIIFNSKAKQTGHISFDLKHMQASKLVFEFKAIAHNYRPVYGFDYQVVDPKREFEEKFKSKN